MSTPQLEGTAVAEGLSSSDEAAHQANTDGLSVVAVVHYGQVVRATGSMALLMFDTADVSDKTISSFMLAISQ